MIKKLFQKLLNKSGKDYQIDQDIPNGFFIRVIYKRMIMLLRGLIIMGRKVYIGSNCSVSNKRNIFFGKNVTIEHHTIIDGYASQKVHIGHGSRIGAYSWVMCTSHFSKYGKGLTMGNNSAVGQFTEFGAAGGIEIGNDVIMGSYVSFHSENHNFSDTTKLIREQGVTSKGIKIGNNVWVGAKVTFLDGCVVGNHCVVAAGAVVIGEFPDYSVIGGIPAKILKSIS
ncbi:acyltransferase [Flavobacterium sp. Sd200]|uniref:acyltransferase n=1 Tax=Flavobacterium sp. Sd200 TaxID=2692211 RepID=UPI00136E83AD|nr:acyltransferase [Flavobacterium sp. Sd200]MXN92579.1 acyltransferase [Flavobacterium sp. Sd200]